MCPFWLTKKKKQKPHTKLSMKSSFALITFLTNEDEPFIGKALRRKKKKKKQNKFKHHYFKNRSLLLISLLKLAIQISKYGIPLINSETYLSLKGSNFHWEERSSFRSQLLSSKVGILNQRYSIRYLILKLNV